MAKGSGGTRGSTWRDKSNDVDNYLKAYTSKGGIDYSRYSKYDNQENEAKAKSYLENANKVDDTLLYRGAYMLSGDIERNLIFGEWVEGDTIISGKEIGTVNTFLSFSRDKNRVFGYVTNQPKPKSNYDKFENEAIRVRYTVKTKGKSFVDISSKSIYPEEKECLADSSKAKFRYISSNFQEKGQFWDIVLEEV